MSSFFWSFCPLYILLFLLARKTKKIEVLFTKILLWNTNWTQSWTLLLFRQEYIFQHRHTQPLKCSKLSRAQKCFRHVRKGWEEKITFFIKNFQSKFKNFLEIMKKQKRFLKGKQTEIVLQYQHGRKREDSLSLLARSYSSFHICISFLTS
jgi:hypothetical protein